MSSFRTSADKLGIPTGVTGETCKGVLICDRHRVSGFIKGTNIPELRDLLSDAHEKYKRVKVPAVVFGLHQPDGSVDYALYADYRPKG